MASKKLKKFLRKRIAIHEKYITRYARPVGAAAAGYFGGELGAAGFTALTHPLHRYTAGVTMREQGLHGLKARQGARKIANRTTIYSAITGTVGAIGSGVTTAIKGGTFGQSMGAFLGGQYGASLFGNGATLFSKAPVQPEFITQANLAGQVGQPVPGIVTEKSLAAQMGAPSAVQTAGNVSTTAGLGTKALTTSYDVINKVLDARAKAADGSSTVIGPAGTPLFGSMGGGEGEGDGGLGLMARRGAAGDSDSMLPLLLIGGALVLMSAA